METKAEYGALLKKYFEPWAHMLPEEQAELLVNTTLSTYKKGDVVHSGEHDCLGVLLIISGMLRTYMLSEEGKEITLFRLERGDMCVLSASCILSTITFDVHIDAEDTSEVLVINSAHFSGLAERNIYVECFTYKLATERFSDVMWAMQQILFMSVDKRLAIFLWDELSKTNGDTIHLTHEQIARYIGSAREVVTRMLNYFAAEKILILSRGGIKISDKEKIQALTY